MQRTHGEHALPHACRQFPRVATLSPLGTSVTLSAFCPTAAALLFDAAPFGVVTRTDARRYEGLDAREVLPPLLRPGMLMDWPAVARWEELVVATLSTYRSEPDTALAIIQRASGEVRDAWTPADGPLSDALDAAFDAGAFDDTRELTTDAAATARFLAAHAFACWPMYDGRGIEGAIDWLLNVRTALENERRSCGDLLEAFRQADLALRHRT